MNSQRFLQRFLRYVQIDTTARAETDDYPSSPGQLELGRLLVAELLAAGVADARQDPHGIVLATIPAVGNGFPPGRRLLRPSGHLAGDDRQGGQAAGDPQLCRRRHRPARRPRPGDSPGRQPRVGRHAGAAR